VPNIESFFERSRCQELFCPENILTPFVPSGLEVSPMVQWESAPPPKSRIRIEHVPAFDARGMKHVYGRGDKFWRKAAFNMDTWRDRDDNLFARFWSRSGDVDGLSVAIHGIPADLIPERANKEGLSDDWIPKQLRDEYENWITSEW